MPACSVSYTKDLQILKMVHYRKNMAKLPLNPKVICISDADNPELIYYMSPQKDKWCKELAIRVSSGMRQGAQKEAGLAAGYGKNSPTYAKRIAAANQAAKRNRKDRACMIRYQQYLRFYTAQKQETG